MTFDKGILFKIAELLVASAQIAVVEFLHTLDDTIKEPIIVFGTGVVCAAIAATFIFSAIINAAMERSVETFFNSICAGLCVISAVLDCLTFGLREKHTPAEIDSDESKIISLSAISLINAIIFCGDIYYKHNK